MLVHLQRLFRAAERLVRAILHLAPHDAHHDPDSTQMAFYKPFAGSVPIRSGVRPPSALSFSQAWSHVNRQILHTSLGFPVLHPKKIRLRHV